MKHFAHNLVIICEDGIVGITINTAVTTSKGYKNFLYLLFPLMLLSIIIFITNKCSTMTDLMFS